MIEETHKRNFELIKKYNLKVGNKLQVSKSKGCLLGFSIGQILTISHINNNYGWILFKETEQAPQEVKEILSFCKKLEGGLKE